MNGGGNHSLDNLNSAIVDYMKKYSISVFFPVYNDAKTIPTLVSNTIPILKKIANDYEIILINDGSADNSGKVVDKLAKKYKNVRVIHHKRNMGYGAALKSGFKSSTKDIIFYTDGDGQYDVKEIKKLLPKLKDYSVVNGYKIKRADPWYRIILGAAYLWLARILFGLKIKDVDCDFRIMTKDVKDKLDLKSNQGVICIEIVKKIQDLGYKIGQVPVHHYPRLDGKSQFFTFKRITRTLLAMVALWYNLVLKGGYKKK